ncbi:hypothetical protein AMATHDRAFT_147951 [Amanita thiersii Skay4041]|uniref:Uncharacterized protein n=1 Tax=Amanita thiersii Skay4041 TaxID=703135 RepID=A0A2A9NNS2_9AGAR|nr:hypothetical protein AMATHDRAFT_147951 [Amanita thiersii Skay4041]
MSIPAVSPLRQLANIISDSVDKIDQICQSAKCDYPSLDAPFNPGSPSEGLALTPEVIQNASLIVAACSQLSSTVNIPALSLYDAIGGFHVASALRAALESNTVEILRQSPNGLKTTEIAAINGMDPTRIARLLRLLATHHIFAEVEPDVFKNNRLSSLMDTLKSVDEITASPENKHVDTPGMSALIEHTGDEVFKGSAFMTDVLLDPVSGHSEAPEHAPLCVAFKTNKPSWEWYEEPENAFRLKRFAAAMAGSAKLDPPNAILQGFNWAELPANSLVVDVGGGIGHTTLKIVQSNPNLKYIVQDRPPVVQQATEFWKANNPSALETGTVKLIAHDFFTPQPDNKVAVFLCRMVMHDHGRNTAAAILRNLRSAASSDTKLLIVDQIVPYACPDKNALAIEENIPGAKQPVPPKPLLTNLGKANAIAYLGDLQMYVGLNGEERTLGSFLELTRSTGWKIIKVFTIPGSMHKQILAIPA